MKEKSYYSELISELDFIVQKHKNVSVTGLCNSILGVNIPIVTIGEGAQRIIYLGGQVGYDKLTPYILTRYIKDICALYQENGSIFGFSAEYILKKYTLVIIPILNPDGLNYCDCGVTGDNPIKERVIKMNNGSYDFSHWRGNARGADLRYNYFLDERLEGIESEPEVGALCNFLEFGKQPDLIFSFEGIENNNSAIYFGDGEQASKIAIALTQMTGLKRVFSDDGESDNTLMSWSNQKISTKTFLTKISMADNPNQKNIKEINFSKYLQIRKMLFCAPILSKIK